MASRQQPRRTARVLALLSLSQIRIKSDQLEDLEINDLILGAIRTLTIEVENTLETAADELNRSNDKIFKSETRTSDVSSARIMLKDAIALTQKAINRVGTIVEIPEFIQVSRETEVKQYAIDLISCIRNNKEEIDSLIDGLMTDWTVNRLTQIDANILRLAVAEMKFFQQDHKIAINEAIEIAKQYSDDDGYRFINGVLRKVSNKLLEN
ncbi:transcription antitermination factor NusB [Cyanobacterium aponinum UTEX 3222]|uniref:Transcription antitermination protein NusB n=3 Tax=Cyanobacterium aponinum TaxID=379064 RepID=K9Z6Z2_CYAAP|nr:transcription antitermination factor NusB [Cyanobacterium aponinum]WRL43114.1 transcription antitermination factor NusB [Cyanobacterium aponinum UTEX 3222]AFZ54909.1 NusB antitermination factor [Cyanobacterium aponinum PCC 10605]MBD2395863.1 transcription antitermination protein NusB [Cyanobacterium aponinum FACHB-4101]MTF39851.1 transcription antitermination protein NusB [Cyanobacterium aponinum 0216]PHV64389.1 transcription antitermination factor NusB [Cyanobacterium aponinum IPPAS B-1201